MDKLGTRPFRDDRAKLKEAAFKAACFFIRNRPNRLDSLIDHAVNQPSVVIATKDLQTTINFNKEKRS